MTTLADWVSQVREHLEGGRSQERNRLAANYTAGSEQMVCQFELGSIGAGAKLSVGTNTLHVWQVAPTSRTVTVSGGEDGTTDQSAAEGTPVLVNPRFTTSSIVRALNTELQALTAPTNGLYRTRTLEITYNASVNGYDLPATGLVDVIEVRREEPGSEKRWPPVRPGAWRLMRSADSTDFPSGTGIRVDDGDPGFAVQVVYKSTFTPLTTLGQDVTDSGLPDTALDLPPLGATITLMSGRDAARNQVGSQPDTRRASEVPPGALTDAIRPLAALRQRRIHEEKQRLVRMHPVRR